MNQDPNSEVEDNLVNLKPRVQKAEVNAEDDEFVKAFESLLTENIAVCFYNFSIILIVCYLLFALIAKNKRFNQDAVC